MKIYIDGKRRRFRKRLPNDGKWHHIVGTWGKGASGETVELRHVKGVVPSVRRLLRQQRRTLKELRNRV